MAYYLYQTSYTTEGVSALIENPQDRLAAVQPVAEKLGGRLINAWMAFGEYDVVSILELPDNVSAVAFSMAVSAGGRVKGGKTTPLMTFEEGIEAMRKAGEAGYRPPK